MKTILLAAPLVTILAGAANASEVTCSGDVWSMKDHDIISADMNNDRAQACVAQHNTKAFVQIGQYCDIQASGACCIFRAHVASRKGNTYFIDRIIGLSPDSTCED